MSPSNTQFSIAVHLLAGLAFSKDGGRTSNALSHSVNTCPSFVRRVVSKLSKANLVKTTSGRSGSCVLARRPEEISLLDIHEAVGGSRAFAIHEYPVQKECPVSSHIKASLETVLAQTTRAVERSLKETTLADVMADIDVSGAMSAQA